MRKKAILSLLMAVTMIKLSAQKPDSLAVLSLHEIITAIEENPAITIFEKRVNSIRSGADAARALEAPQVSTGLWMMPYNLDENMGAYMFSGRQMIMNPVKRNAERDYMLGMVKVEEAIQSYELADMVAMAKKAYYETIVLQKKLKLINEALKIMEILVESGEISFKYNQGMLSRIYKAKSEIASLRNIQLMTLNEIKMRKIEINTLMNRNKDQDFILSDSLLPAVAISEKPENINLSNRSDILVLNQQQQVNDLQIKLEKTKRLPDFGLEYGHMQGRGIQPNQFNFMGMITLPFAPWSSKSYKSKIKALEEENEAISHQKESLLNSYKGELQTIVNKINTMNSLIQNYNEELIPALEKTYKSSLLAYEHMKEDLFMVLDAANELYMARMNMIDLEVELIKAGINFERITESHYEN